MKQDGYGGPSRNGGGTPARTSLGTHRLRAPFTFRAWNSFQEARDFGLGLAQTWIFIFPMIQHPKLAQAP